jgi:hypothetical protein
MTIQDNLNRAFAPLASTLVTTSASVGTSAAKVITGAEGSVGAAKMVRLKNLHGTQSLAFTRVYVGDTAPTVTASASSTDGIVLGPGEVEAFALRGDQDLYVVGSAATTTYNLATW